MVPTLKSYEDLMISADGTRIGWIGLLLGYSIIWVTFSALITAFQLILLSLGLVDMMGKVKSIWISSALLIIAGAFQFTRAKEVCHGICHSPMSYFLGNWKTGFNGGLRMGIGLGTFCVGCCRFATSGKCLRLIKINIFYEPLLAFVIHAQSQSIEV